MQVPPDGLVPRLLASEIAYTEARAAVIARWPGNPFGVATRRDGAVFACQVPAAIRAPVKDNIRGWLGLPGWHLLLAWHEGMAAASCVLFVADGVAYIADMATRPEHRGRGLQTALLAACHARAAGAEVMWARCRFLSQSHRNLQRAGLRTLCTTAFWSAGS